MVIGEELGHDGSRIGSTFAWIVDFPMYEFDEETGRTLDFSHNPFSMPQGGMEALETKRAAGYTWISIRYRVQRLSNSSSGAIRNHKPEIMYKAFEIVGHGEDEAFVDANFGGMINAFKLSAPHPMAVCALGH